VHCETQAEVDHFWARLTAGGEEIQCGWLKDRINIDGLARAYEGRAA